VIVCGEGALISVGKDSRSNHQAALFYLRHSPETVRKIVETRLPLFEVSMRVRQAARDQIQRGSRDAPM
jgi:hypothetical protein